MKKTKLYLVLILSLFIGLIGLQAQNLLKVISKNGVQTPIKLSDIQKITFGSVEMKLLRSDASTQIYGFDNIRILNFDTTSNNINQINTLENNDLHLYPNPVINNVAITFESSTKGSIAINIFDFQGKIVFQKYEHQLEGKNKLSIDLSKLQKGIYVCQLTNSTTNKICKFLKF
jgi:hypothetical protein